MKRIVLAVALALTVSALAGCGGGANSNSSGDSGAAASDSGAVELDSKAIGLSSEAAQPATTGYIPTRISNMTNGGVLPSGEPAQQHDGGAPSLNKLEGQWICESVDPDKNYLNESDSHAVTDETMTINDRKVECLPKSIDIRPYSPIQTLFTHGFGYGAALFEDAVEPNEAGIHMIESVASLPYSGDGFVCASNGSTLALGFLDPNCEMEENGIIADEKGNAVDECALTEIDYEVALEGDRLTISYGNVSASYVHDDSAWSRYHDGTLYTNLYDGDEMVDPFKFQDLKKLTEAGYDVTCDTEDMLPSLESSDEFKVTAPDGSVFKAKVFNPYEKKVPLWNLPVSWCKYEEGDGDLTVGMGAESSIELGSTQVFGSSTYAQVYNNYPLPYDSSPEYLCYKAGSPARILTITAFGEGFDTGETLVESEHSCDVRFGFKDGTLISFTKEDSAYTAAGLQDNVERDDLAELEPSVYRGVEEQRDEILSELKEAFEKAGVEAAINESTGEVTMDNNVLFDVDSYELGSEGEKYLDKVFTAYASVVLDNKFSDSLKSISFEGNTDSDGASEYNMVLSENRADAVMEYCASLLDANQKAVFDKLATSKGYGESDLVYDEKGNEDKNASRRVAIKFMMKVDSSEAGAGSQSDSGSSESASASAASSGASEDASAPAASAGVSSEPSAAAASSDASESASASAASSGASESASSGSAGSSSASTAASTDAPSSSSGSGGASPETASTSSTSSGSSDTTNSTASSSASSSSSAQGESEELKNFRSISDNFDLAWALTEGSESEHTRHVAYLLLSEDHRYCLYFDIKEDGSTSDVNYTFGETSIEEEAENAQRITVKHHGDEDEMLVVFNAWKREDMVNLVDPWKEVYNLTESDNVDGAVSFFDELIANNPDSFS